MIKINSLHDLHEEEKLLEIISGGETSTLEFKRDITDVNSIARLMSSFANTDGGIILFGIDEDGIIQGIKNVDHFNDIAQNAFVKTTPSISGYSAGIVNVKEKPLGCILIWPQKGFPISVDNQYFRRVGHQTISFGAEEFKKVIEEREEPTLLFISSSEIQSFIKEADEDTFTETLLVPIIRQLGFSCVFAKGHNDKSLEFGQDIRGFKFRLPTGHWLYFAAQVKAGPITYSPKKPSSNIEQLLIQVRMAQHKEMFDYETNTYHKPDLVILIASGEIVEGARLYLCEQLAKTSGQRILFWDSNLISERSEECGLPTGVQYEIRNFLKKISQQESPQPSKNELLGEFLSMWVSIEQTLTRLAELTYPQDEQKGKKINIGPIPSFLARDKTINKNDADEIEELRGIRNKVIHGEISHKSTITSELMQRMEKVYGLLKDKLSTAEKYQQPTAKAQLADMAK